VTGRSERARRTLVLGALSAFAPMSVDLYLPAFPALEQALHADAASIQWTLAAFFIGFAAGQILYGPVTDRYGRKPPLYAGLAVYIAASAGCAVATSAGALIGLRLLQALGACAAAVTARAMVRDLFEPREAARVFSTLMLVMGVAPILAPLAGGYILLWGGWQAIFWVLAAFGAACLAAAAWALPETHAGNPHRSLRLGPVLRDYARILAAPAFHRNVAASSVSIGGMFAYITASPFVFIQHFGVSAQAYGWFFGANAFGLIAASQLNRVLLQRAPARRIVVAALAVQAVAGLAVLAGAWTGAGGVWGVAAPLFIYIACLGLILPNTAAAALAPFAREAGAASALLGSVQFGLAGVVSAVVGAVHAESAVPMAAAIAVCGVAAFAIVPHGPLPQAPEHRRG
jgi:DHA1 family bicyclomycin/chloramphenicol resistance-like MFS transporter